MSDFTLQNPVFATYVVAACLMILKVVAMSWLTVVRMMQVNGGYRSPEDARKSPVNANPREGQVGPNEKVDRIRRIQLNDLENIPFFLVAGLLYAAPVPVVTPREGLVEHDEHHAHDVRLREIGAERRLRLRMRDQARQPFRSGDKKLCPLIIGRRAARRRKRVNIRGGGVRARACGVACQYRPDRRQRDARDARAALAPAPFSDEEIFERIEKQAARIALAGGKARALGEQAAPQCGEHRLIGKVVCAAAAAGFERPEQARRDRRRQFEQERFKSRKALCRNGARRGCRWRRSGLRPVCATCSPRSDGPSCQKTA